MAVPLFRTTDATDRLQFPCCC